MLLTSPWPESLYAFAPMWATLAEHARLFAVDLPGFGASERRDDLLSPRAMGGFLARLIAEADLGRPHIVAPDVGTSAALFAAAAHPERFASVIVGTGGAAVPLQLGEPLRSWVLDPDLDKYRRMDPRVIVNAAVDTIAGGVPDDIRADYLDCYDGDRFVESMRYVRRYPEELPVLAELLPQIATPVTIINGRHDRVVPVANAEFLDARLPNSRLVLIDAGHFVWEEAPAEYAVDRPRLDHASTTDIRSSMEAASTKGSATATDVREFTIDVPEEQLEDLRSRIEATKWPDREMDPSQGVRLETIHALADYWATDYDWRRFEERFAALPHFITEIDGVDIHFIHVRSEHEDALPLDRHARVAGLDDRAAEDHRSAHRSHGARRERGGRLPPRDPLAAGPRVLGQADRDRLGPDPDRARLGRADGAPRIRPLRGAGRRLGQCRHRAAGSAEAPGTAGHPHQHAGDRSAGRLEGACVRRSGAGGPLGR